MHVKPLPPSLKNHYFALRICVDDRCCVGDTCWSGRHRAGYFDYLRIAITHRQTLVRGS